MHEGKTHHGLYRGVIKDIKDPQGLRRIKVVVPQVTGDETTDWVWPVEPSNVQVTVPSVGQGVWVSYQGGDPDYPVWHGMFGTNQGAYKNIALTHLSNSTSLTGLTDYLILITNSDGTKAVDLMATLLAMANKLKNYETRIHTLETTPDIDS